MLLASFYRYLVRNGTRQYSESDIFNTKGASILAWLQVALTKTAHDEILLLYNNKNGVRFNVLQASGKDG